MSAFWVQTSKTSRECPPHLQALCMRWSCLQMARLQSWIHDAQSSSRRSAGSSPGRTWCTEHSSSHSLPWLPRSESRSRVRGVWLQGTDHWWYLDTGFKTILFQNQMDHIENGDSLKTCICSVGTISMWHWGLVSVALQAVGANMNKKFIWFVKTTNIMLKYFQSRNAVEYHHL